MATENEIITASLNELEADVTDKQLLSERLKLFIAALDAPKRTDEDEQPKRKRGRPLGSRNKPKVQKEYA
jgi:chaperonin cofactor prefoldin